MRFLNIKTFKFIFLIGTILFSFFLGFYCGEEGGIYKGMELVSPAGKIDLSLFWESYNVLEKKYVGREEFDHEKMIYGAISGMVESLDDPYTIFMPPEETNQFFEDVSGVFEGVGMEIGIRNDQLQVIAPLEGTPAQKAGLRAGDKIFKVGDEHTRDLTIDEAVHLIRGPKGTEVVLTIARNGWEKTQEIKIIRGIIEMPSIKWELLEDDTEADPIVYMRLYQFLGTTGSAFQTASVKILNTSAKKIILDLRNNPGGYLEVSQYIAGWFLEKDQIVTIEDFGPDQEKLEYLAKGNGAFKDFEIVVLMNQGSASASEILAGALRDNCGIKIIGETSFGKGSVQELERLRNGSSLKITVAKWLTPNGNLIAGKGIEPDIEVKMTNEDYEEGNDPQLDRAVELLKETR